MQASQCCPTECRIVSCQEQARRLEVLLWQKKLREPAQTDNSLFNADKDSVKIVRFRCHDWMVTGLAQCRGDHGASFDHESWLTAVSESPAGGTSGTCFRLEGQKMFRPQSAPTQGDRPKTLGANRFSHGSPYQTRYHCGMPFGGIRSPQNCPRSCFSGMRDSGEVAQHQRQPCRSFRSTRSKCRFLDLGGDVCSQALPANLLFRNIKSQSV
jgi:hypothetical protein